MPVSLLFEDIKNQRLPAFSVGYGYDIYDTKQQYLRRSNLFIFYYFAYSIIILIKSHIVVYNTTPQELLMYVVDMSSS